MLTLRIVNLSAALYITCALAVQDPISVALQLYPSCAITCLYKAVPTSACELTDVDCLCHDEPLNSNLTICVYDTCSTVDALAARNGSATLCKEPVRNMQKAQGLVGIIGCSITFAIFLTRIISNLSLNGTGFGWDDFIITFAMVFTICASVLAPVAASYGVGRDIWTLPINDIENALFYFLLGELAYFGAVGSAKASILVFMLRIFPDRTFRRVVYVTVTLVVSYAVAFIIATVFQCQPVQYFWKQLDDSAKGQCNNINLQAWLSAALNIVLDLIILALPLKSLWSLQLSLARKLTVMAMFSLGIFVTIISAIRMHTFIAFSSSLNFTWDYKDGGTWSLIELYASIVCACLPSLRIMAHFLHSKWLGSTKYVRSSIVKGQSSTLSNGSINKQGDSNKAQKPPVWGDEGDFVRLVDIEGRKVEGTNDT